MIHGLRDGDEFGIQCGICGGVVYVETCEQATGIEGHTWGLATECQQCGRRAMLKPVCPDCNPLAERTESTQ